MNKYKELIEVSNKFNDLLDLEVVCPVCNYKGQGRTFIKEKLKKKKVVIECPNCSKEIIEEAKALQVRRPSLNY